MSETAVLVDAGVSGPRRRLLTGNGRPMWSAAVLLAAALVVTPVAAVVIDGLGSLNSGSLPQDIGPMIVTTVLLMGGVGLSTLLIGGGLAWLVTAHDFPLRNLLSWALVLPLAMPAYILGFVFLSTFDVGGPVQGMLRTVLGPGAWLPDVRTLAGAVVVMSLTLYPYVYLLARSALVEQSATTYDAARTLGAGRSRALWRVVVPMARPSLAAALALVMMETLTDFATVQYFNVQTVSVGVYLVWKGSFDFHAATQLSVLVLVFAVAVLAGERLLRGRSRFHQKAGRGEGLKSRRLTGWRGWAAALACLSVLGAGFILPVAQLAGWAVGEAAGGSEPLLDPRFVEYLVNSVTVASLAALVCAALALTIGHAQRLGGGPLVAVAAQATTFGYAVPGAVIGIGVLIAFARVDEWLELAGVPGGTGLLVTGSVAGILCAYVVRFIAPAHQAVDASFAKISPALTFSALSLGSTPRRLLTRVHLPLARRGAAVALVLVAIDAVKELPIVLLLRPFGFTTISVWVYELARENFWEKAALPALGIVAVAVIPVYFLFRRSAGLKAGAVTHDQ
ncbi:iron(III) transport system permease protein [Arthrobacter subterraneus]|uniref:Iron(III) transport system permease protein n=1 Tax=Arthrobacter subterraneus TaxID=335973 RepID=A0A1G8CQT9_9MICC|nr:iron ABC transporter permease [Arthrobacter subterraneus]SDH47897.1 iron(III) transport system permease protein [Arthrobacter subterraneus]